MAGVKGPLLSIRAKGSIGQTLTFASWRGMPITKTHAAPSNPKTAAQERARSVWAYLNALYRALPPSAQHSWQTAGATGIKTAVNLWLAANQTTLYHASNTSALLETRAGRNAPQEPPPTITSGPGTISATSPGPTPPEGWTLDFQYLDALPDQNATTYAPPLPPVETSGAQQSPLNWTLRGLISGQLYQVYVYSRLTNPHGQQIYTAANHGQATPT